MLEVRPSRGPRGCWRRLSPCPRTAIRSPTATSYKRGRVAEGERAYRVHLSMQRGPLDELATLLRLSRTCLLCLEADHRICHRSAIVDALRTRLPDLVAVHL